MKDAQVKLEYYFKNIVMLKGNLIESIEGYRDTLRRSGIERNVEILTLTLNHVIAAIEMYLSGNISEDELSQWASILEFNEFLDYDDGDASAIAEALFVIGSPEVNGPVTPDSCRSLLAELLNFGK